MMHNNNNIPQHTYTEDKHRLHNIKKNRKVYMFLSLASSSGRFNTPFSQDLGVVE